MSINTAMTAIADKIRGLLGLSGAMGLDAMASNLAVEQANIADAYAVVSSKGGTVPESKVSGNLAAAIGTIGTGGLDTSDATAADILAGKTAYVNGQKVTGTHECAVSQPALQSKTVSPSESQQTVSPDSGYDGLSSVTVGAVSRTYVGSGVTKKSAATYTPGTDDQTIASGQYLSGAQTIKGDANLLAENIKNGVSIFGVYGTFASQPVDAQLCEVIPIAIDNKQTGTTVPLLKGNAFLAEHCNDEALLVALISLKTIGDHNTISAIYHGNRRNVTYSNSNAYGSYSYIYYNTIYGASISAGTPKYPINNTETLNVVRLAVNESGDLNLCLSSSISVNAGSYLAVLVLAAA